MPGGTQCPGCGKSYPDEVVICTNCGIDLRTGEKLPEEMMPSHSSFDIFPVIKTVIYLVILGGAGFFAWTMYSTHIAGLEGTGSGDEAGPAEARTVAPTAPAQPAAPVRRTPPRPEPPKKLTPREELPEVLAGIACPVTHNDAMRQLSRLVAKDYSLVQTIMSSEDPVIRMALASVLGRVRTRQAASDLIRLMTDENDTVSETAFTAAGSSDREKVQEAALEALASPDPDKRISGLRLLIRFRYDEDPDAFRKLFDDEVAGIRAILVEYFGTVRCPGWAFDKMIELAGSTSEPVVAYKLSVTLRRKVDKNNVEKLLKPAGEYDLFHLPIILPAALIVGGGKADEVLAARIEKMLTVMDKEERSIMTRQLLAPSEQSRRQALTRMIASGDLPRMKSVPAMTLLSGSQDAQAVNAQTFWLVEADKAVLPLCAMLWSEDNYVAMCAALALAQQEKGLIRNYAGKVRKAGGEREKLLANIALYAAGETGLADEVIDTCLSSGVASEIKALGLATAAPKLRDKVLHHLETLLEGSNKNDLLTPMIALAGIYGAGRDEAWDDFAERLRGSRRKRLSPLGWYAAFLVVSRSIEPDYSRLADLFSKEDLWAGTVVGTLLGRKHPDGLLEKMVEMLPRMDRSMALPAAQVARGYGDQGRQAILSAIESPEDAARRNAMEILNHFGGGSVEDTLAMIEAWRKADDQHLAARIYHSLRQNTGKDYGSHWQSWYKAFAPARFDYSEEVLEKKLVDGMVHVLVPVTWARMGGSYTEKNVPGEPRISISGKRDSQPPAKRQYADSQAMTAALKNRYSFDFIERRRKRGVKVSTFNSFDVQGTRIYWFTVEDTEEEKSYVVACGVQKGASFNAYLEVECSVSSSQFSRFEKLFERVVKSMEPVRMGL